MSTGTRLILEREGIGSYWWVNTRDELAVERVEAIAARLSGLMDEFDALYSRFRPDSLVTQLNEAGELRDVPAELYNMLMYCEQLREVSGGLFNVGVGAQLEALGYGAGYRFMGAAGAPLTGSVMRELTRERVELEPGARIDLGGIGKGWLIDRMGEVLADEGLVSYLVNGGGDMLAESPGEPWVVALEDPVNTATAIGTVGLVRGAVAASGASKRSWIDGVTGERRHHLVDALSGESHAGPLAVHTTAGTATAADAASTVLYLAKAEDVESLAKVMGAEYLIVYQEGVAVRSPGYDVELY